MSDSSHQRSSPPPTSVHFAGPDWWRVLIDVEVALTSSLARAGAIPADAGAQIEQAARDFTVNTTELAASIATHGFPVLGLVAQLKAHVGAPADRWVHWGGTTQDILDNALVLQLSRALDGIDTRLADLTTALGDLARAHRDTICLARTHLQAAVPTSYALKAGAWLSPLPRHRARLPAVRARLRTVQAGGAGGTFAAWGEHAPAIVRELAATLDLNPTPLPWHQQRDAVLETADWCALVAQSLVKFGQDLLLLSQSDLAEVDVSAGAAGGSSAMPQKCNPIRAEQLLQAARRVLHERHALALTPPPENERGTATTATELTHLPLMTDSLVTALDTALALARHLRIDARRARDNLDATRGLVLAEAATHALSAHLPPARARAVVAAACVEVRTGTGDLLAVLRRHTDAPVNWSRLADPAAQLTTAHRQLDALLASLPVPASP